MISSSAILRQQKRVENRMRLDPGRSERWKNINREKQKRNSDSQGVMEELNLTVVRSAFGGRDKKKSGVKNPYVRKRKGGTFEVVVNERLSGASGKERRTLRVKREKSPTTSRGKRLEIRALARPSTRVWRCGHPLDNNTQESRRLNSREVRERHE